MTTEVMILAYAMLVQLVQFVLMAVTSNLQVGAAYAASARDEPRVLTGMAGRMKRAFDNHFEGLILFTIAVVVVTLGNAASALTATAAWIYLIARIAYVPAYGLGIPYLRSAVWMVGFFATFTMIFAALFSSNLPA